jgi:hypothetical protein
VCVDDLCCFSCGSLAEFLDSDSMQASGVALWERILPTAKGSTVCGLTRNSGSLIICFIEAIDELIKKFENKAFVTRVPKAQTRGPHAQQFSQHELALSRTTLISHTRSDPIRLPQKATGRPEILPREIVLRLLSSCDQMIPCFPNSQSHFVP